MSCRHSQCHKGQSAVLHTHTNQCFLFAAFVLIYPTVEKSEFPVFHERWYITSWPHCCTLIFPHSHLINTSANTLRTHCYKYATLTSSATLSFGPVRCHWENFAMINQLSEKRRLCRLCRWKGLPSKRIENVSSVCASQALKHSLLLQLLSSDGEEKPFVSFHTSSTQNHRLLWYVKSAAVSCSRAKAAVCVSTDDSCMQPWFLFFHVFISFFFLLLSELQN